MVIVLVIIACVLVVGWIVRKLWRWGSSSDVAASSFLDTPGEGAEALGNVLGDIDFD